MMTTDGYVILRSVAVSLSSAISSHWFYLLTRFLCMTSLVVTIWGKSWCTKWSQNCDTKVLSLIPQFLHVELLSKDVRCITLIFIISISLGILTPSWEFDNTRVVALM